MQPLSLSFGRRRKGSGCTYVVREGLLPRRVDVVAHDRRVAVPAAVARFGAALGPGDAQPAALLAGHGGVCHVKEAQRAPRLMTTAYEVDDGLIEGLESPEHSWVIGLQCHPERQEEVPNLFNNIFLGLKERADNFVPASET